MNLAVNFRLVSYMCGWVALGLASSMLFPVGIAMLVGDGTESIFLLSAALVGGLGFILILSGHGSGKEAPNSRDGLATVGLAWVMIGFLGAVPYWLSGTTPTFWDGLFESFSGFSTTGATIFSDLEALPKSILFWRALSNWLGGMGIIVLMLAILPFFGLNGAQLFKNESTFGRNKLKPRIATTAKILWYIYVGLTLILLGLLLAGGMKWFDAVCHTFTTIATGGFSNRNLSVGHFDSAYIEIVITSFMFIGSLNFALFYAVTRGDWKTLFTNIEARIFFTITVVCSLVVCFSLWYSNFYGNFGETLRHSFFQVVSVISTTGLTSDDWEKWPHLSQGVLLTLFFIGGCAGSTSGGMKCIRWILLFKGIHRTLRQHIHPRAIFQIKLGNQAVPESMMTALWSFGAIYFIAILLSTLALSALDLDLLTAFSASASSIGNVGVALGEVGPAENYGHLPGLAKGILSLNMFLGRLEFFALLILFLPDFWKK